MLLARYTVKLAPDREMTGGVIRDSLLGVKHPYYPESLELPGYVPPLLPFTVVLAIFFSSSILLFLASWALSGVYVVLACAKGCDLCVMITSKLAVDLQAHSGTCKALIVQSFVGLP